MGNLSLIGPSNQGVIAKVESQRSINWYPVKGEREGERWHLRGRPGLSLLCTLPRSPIRGVVVKDGRFFCVAGARVYEVYANGGSREWGVISSVTGKVSMAVLLEKIIIGDGGGYYALDLTAGTLAAITDAPRGRFCVFFKQRILYQHIDTGEIFYSELNDATDIPGANFFTAESLPDAVVAITTSEDQVLLHGKDSTEPWFNSGDVDNPFEPVQGGTVHSGCAWPDTALKLDNSAWWVESDKDGIGIVRRMQGATPVRVSTSAVERFTATATNLSAHTYQEEGHAFYVLNADEGTWAYDLKENEWHERAWLNRNTGEQERSRPELHAHALGGHVVTDYENGKVYLQSLEYHSDAGQEIRRTRVSHHIEKSGERIIIDELFLDFATGVGLDGSGQGTDPQVMLRVSKDGTGYGREMRAPLGKIGNFRNRVRFPRLGQGTDWMFEISVSDPVLSVLQGGDMRSRGGRR